MDQPKSKDPQKELEIAVGELEERVDRLRASYEQYFLGYEKLEPSIQRKEVDRRFAHLRKQQIRNTALRFKFNVVTQKFHTYSMYWTRVCRQIEEGTFKRHVIKAAKRFGGTETKRDADFSIEVELGDFEEVDMDALLAEVDAETATRSREGLTADTTPPGMPTEPPPMAENMFPSGGDPKQPAGAWFAVGGMRDAVGTEPPLAAATANNTVAPRSARQASLPAGAKGRIVLRRRPDGDVAPPSAPTSRGPLTPLTPLKPLGSLSLTPQARPSLGGTLDPVVPPQPAPVIRTAPMTSPGEGSRSVLPGGTPDSGGRPPPPAPVTVTSPPTSAGRPSASPSWAGAAGKIPAIAPAGTSGRPPLGGGPVSRIPTPLSPMTPQGPARAGVPVGRPPIAAPQPSPAAAPPPNAPRPSPGAAAPPNANRLPEAGSTPRTPASPMVPMARPVPGGGPPPGPQPPAASPPASSADSDQARSNRRAPPLPSQIKKTP